MKKLQVLVSTQNLANDFEVGNLVEKMNIKTDYVIINQNSKNNVNINNRNTVTKKEKGLSKSRNLAIEKATGEIILFADDDVKYNDDYEKVVLKEWKKYNNADIICFYMESKNPKRKIKRMLTGKIGYIRAMKVVSMEISAKREIILNHNIKFNEDFGAGAKFNRGEETLFLYDALKEGLNIIFINKKIGEAKQEESIWFTGFDEEFFKTQGEVFKAMTKKYYKLLIYQYAIRKYFLYKDKISLKRAIQCMMVGRE